MTIKMTKAFSTAYVCGCGKFTVKQYNYTKFGAFDRIHHIDCCPECGASTDNINLVSGKWEYEESMAGLWPCKYKKFEYLRFIPVDQCD